MAQIRPNAPKFRRREKAISYQKAATTGNKRFDPELRLMQKAANERLRQLEKQGIKSPAYNALQAKLEILGKERKGQRGRRFSETGKAAYNEMEVLDKILNEFLYEQKTSTLSGAREYERDVWETANKNNQLAAAGISRDEWLDFWKSMPDRKERLYGSSQIVAMVRAYSIKNKELEDEDKMSVQEIADEIQNSKNLKSAYKALGLTYSDVSSARIKRKGVK